MLSTISRAIVSCIILVGCAQQAEPQEAAPTCSAPQLVGRLPAVIEEASGVAPSSRHPGVWWILIDEPPAALTAVDSTGKVVGRVNIQGAEAADWESLTSSRCGSSVCLYIGDTGDNERRRERRTVYRIEEPALSDQRAQATAFHFQYPNARYDAEAIFVLPGEQLYVVTKGRGEPITVFKYPGTLTANQTVVLEPVQKLSQGLVQFPEMVTGAGATLDGRFIVLRTYAWLQLFKMENGFLLPQLPGQGVALQPLGQPQGEGVDIRDDGQILLVTEQGPGNDGPAPIGMLRCSLTSVP